MFNFAEEISKAHSSFYLNMNKIASTARHVHETENFDIAVYDEEIEEREKELNTFEFNEKEF